MVKITDVWIKKSRARSLITSAIEVYNKETDGVFSGEFVLRKFRGRKKTVLYVHNTNSFQTAERKPSEVFHGNMSAFKRVLHSLTTSDIDFLGGYHSHPFPYKGVRLSKSDVEFIKDELGFLRRNKHFRTQNKWLEILMCIRKVRFERKRKTGWKLRKMRKRVKFTATINEYTRYQIIMAAFWIDFSEKKPVITEKKIHIRDDD